MASPIKTHTISTYDNRFSLTVSKAMHAALFRDTVKKLMMQQSVTFSPDHLIRFRSIKTFTPGVQSLVQFKLGYSEGDQIAVELELDYIKNCLKLLFKDKLLIANNENERSEGLFILKSVTFQLKSPVSEVPGMDLPPFPEPPPAKVTFSPQRPWQRFWDPLEQKSKT